MKARGLMKLSNFQLKQLNKRDQEQVNEWKQHKFNHRV